MKTWDGLLVRAFAEKDAVLDAEFAARFGNSEAFVDENTEEASAVREGIESDYYCALKARNRYGRDECADLREIAAGLLPLDKQIQIEKNVFENYPMLVRDRVELSEEYLAVIDEVERLLEKECGENAHPLETAQAKARLLSERGILWRSEMQLNPGVLFD